MRYKFFTSSLRSWQAMWDAIKEAQESVYLEMYIFKDDMPPFDFLNLLGEKAKQGVRVRVILDSFGSAGLSKEAVAGLREAGGQLFFFSRFFYRMHRKILITDEGRVFIGGVNLSERFKFWNDLVVELTDQRIVARAVHSFARVYFDCGGRDPLVLDKNPKVHTGGRAHNWFVEHLPFRNKFKLKELYRSHISQAQKSIVLVTPYFAPKRWLVAALHHPVLRGVNVEVLVPKATDYFFTDRVNFYYMYKLTNLGINFYVESHMNHAKLMLLDEGEGMVGSNNLDFLSFDLNSEVGVFIKDAGAIEKLWSIVKNWKAGAVKFDPKTYKPKLLDYILSPLFRLFARIF